MNTVVSLFSGAGGLDLGFINAGFKIIWSNEMDKNAVKTYRKNIGNHITESSIENIKDDEIPKADVVIGGPPCQGFSVAGKMDLSDPRSKMVWEFFRVVRAKKPKFFVMENVPSFGTLKKFHSIRNSLIEAFKNEGYFLDYKILESQLLYLMAPGTKFLY